MHKTEKKLLKNHLIVIIIVLAIFASLQMIGNKVLGNEFKDYLFTWEWQEQYNAMELDQLLFSFDQDGIVRLGEVTKEDGWIVYRLYPEHAGKVSLAVADAETGETLLETRYHVSHSGVITDYTTGNFTNYRMYHLSIVINCAVMAFCLWFFFARTQKRLRYSYQSIFYSGLALWMTLIAMLQIRLWLEEDVMSNVYANLQSASEEFLLYTFLPLLVFCIALSISNVSLIRHEGFRTRNALGIFLSIIMIVVAVVCLVLPKLIESDPSMRFRWVHVVISIVSTVYAVVACFLIGAIICGSVAAKQKPDYDRDYLIILGCMIRQDGTLYPLIRGRVDSAIAFYKEQLEKTGKKAFFLPSGGKGSDEPIAEAEAMKRYLLEQGIPEEQILVEDQSVNTVQNMVFSKKLIIERDPKAKAAFSTTNFHVFRSGIIARQNDFEPQGISSPTKWYFWPNAYMREVVGMMAYKWKSLILVMIPVVAFIVAIQFVG